MSKENVQLSPLFDFRDEVHSALTEHEGYVLGKILTIIDASVADLEQRKAVKDLVRNAIFTSPPHKVFTYTILRFANQHIPSLAPKTSEEEKQFLNVGSQLEDSRED